MATLHFDTDAGRNTSSTISASSNNIQSELSNLRSRVSSMVGGEWQGNSANQFEGEFQNWAQQLQTTLNTLDELKMKLDREIQEWETAASSLA
jgi:WXG100 family type VII secretion target